MATLVCFHAHPDDEAIATGGVMAKAAAEGHRVVLVTATRGEHGEVAEGVLAAGETLASRRVRELAAAAGILGAVRQEFLGYVDSGMMGTKENELAGTFWQADPEEAAQRLASILRDERADALTIYDAHGGYGHPDHVQVHRVGIRAAEIAGTARVFEATINRDHVRALLAAAAASEDRAEAEQARELTDDGLAEMGVPSSEINTTVDVAAWVGKKREAMLAHASQISADSWFATLPPEAFTAAFGVEWFILRDAPEGWAGTDLLSAPA